MKQSCTRGKTNKLGVLDTLAAKSGCMYLSDLAGTGRRAFLSHYLWELDADAYSLKEWEDAVHYLTGENLNFSSQESAREYLAGPIPGSKKRRQINRGGDVHCEDNKTK